MAKVVPQDMIDAGFMKEMFGVTDPAAFDTYLSRAIERQSLLLSARIGADLYNTEDPQLAEYVVQAETSLAIAEMWRRRITRKLGQAQGDSPSCKYEEMSLDLSLQEAEGWIFRLIGGDLASGVDESSHFDGLGIWDPYDSERI